MAGELVIFQASDNFHGKRDVHLEHIGRAGLQKGVKIAVMLIFKPPGAASADSGRRTHGMAKSIALTLTHNKMSKKRCGTPW